ncbi:odorant receptor 46a-like [Leguminivora glycinivorella]|uniref:odorant receptor 46a-like n=1 Tax=Leguminivora glycinivorella TaxID=1035111 RepID=UPI00200E36A2|nr:odorant receptor 46a-like [Leguminivora glycinivorella]
MGVVEKNVCVSVCVSLTALKLFGFWAPAGLTGTQRALYNCYGFLSFMFILGTYLIIQVVDMFLIWGDVALMTGTAFVLFTNLAHTAKIAAVVARQDTLRHLVDDADELLAAETGPGKEIVDSCNRETWQQQLLYCCLTTVTVAGWATSAEKNQLPLRAWYPYDTSVSPAYELTYLHQVGALFVAAYLNVGKDTLVASLIAQARCRLRLAALNLASLTDGLTPNAQGTLSAEQEAAAWSRLAAASRRHQAALAAAAVLQACFSAPVFAQFGVSMIIICVTAFQLTAVRHTGNLVRLASMGTYLLNMMFQVFIYCYQGNQLSEESMEIATAAYSCGWTACSARLRRGLLLVMVRTRRAARLSAGGFATLSLASFMAIVKTSYSLFTVLQQADEQK